MTRVLDPRTVAPARRLGLARLRTVVPDVESSSPGAVQTALSTWARSQSFRLGLVLGSFAVAASTSSGSAEVEASAGRAGVLESQTIVWEGEVAEALTIELAVPDAVNQGAFLIGVLRVTNTSDQPQEVSSRLNLLEGDVRLVVTAPGGTTSTLHGASQVDSGLRTIALGPGQSLESGLFLSYTSQGFTFDQPGLYRLQAEYDPSVRTETIRSEAIEILVEPPLGEEGLLLSDAARRDQVMRSIALGGALGDSQATSILEVIAQELGEGREGAIARLALAAGSTSPSVETLTEDLEITFRGYDPVLIAQWITAVTSVTSSTENRLTEAFLAHLDRVHDVGGLGEAIERARRIVERQALDQVP